jgi:hypothetical protein
MWLSNTINYSERYMRVHTELDERRAHDTQHIAVLQLVGENDLAIFESDQSNDKHMQKVH